jgi:hypothetical protein
MESEAANMDMDQAASVEAMPEAETRDDAPMPDLSVPNKVEVQIDMDVQEKLQDNQEPAPALEEEEGAQQHADPPVAASDPIEASKVDTIATGGDPAAEEARRSTRRRVKPNEAQAKPPEIEPRVTRKRQVKQDTQMKDDEKKDAHAEEDPQAKEGDDEKEEAATSKKRGRAKPQVKEEPTEQGKTQEGNNQGANAKQPAKRQRKPAAASVKDESEDALADDNDKKSTRVSFPAPGLPAYKRLSKSDKEEALVAAIEDYDKAYEGLRSASLHLGQHISPWFAHPFVASQDSKLVKTLKRCMTKPDASVLTKNASKATELYSLWRKLHSLDPATAAALRERHGERALTAQDLASFSSSAPATAGAASKVVPPSTSAPQPQPPPPAQHEEAPHQISLASFFSTGDPSRDKTVAAIFQALFSASLGAADLLDIAVAAEKRVFDASGEEQGAYIRKAFLLWSLCAPESEHYDEGVRQQLLAGQPPDVLS